MKNNGKKVIGNIFKCIYKIVQVIVFLYFGSLVIIDLIIYPIVNGKAPEFFGYRYYFSENKKVDKEKESDWKDSIEIIDGIISVSISNLGKAYRTNAIEANKIFQGNILKLTGKINSIQEQYPKNENKYYFFIEEDSDSWTFESVIVYLKNAELEIFENLVIGQTVTIVGEFTGKDVFLEIKDAFFE